ncbi:hypothetical protein PMAYCL1PPCAC_06844, partial [Pristionchus mayeri]
MVDIVLYIDIHAHSQKTNSFLYGNPSNLENHKDRKLWLPYALSSVADDFSLAYTQFNKDADKEGTGRRAMGSVLSCECFTLEVSFFSYRPSDSLTAKPIPYLSCKYESLGEHLCLAVKSYVESLRNELSLSLVNTINCLLKKTKQLRGL